MPLAPSFCYMAGFTAAAASEADRGNDTIAIGITIGIMKTIIQEWLSYNILLTDNFGLNAYISPLQFDFLKNEGNVKGD